MPPKIKRGFNLGGPVAESDPLLSEAFYDNGDYSSIESRDDDRRFIIGRTGSGKSAAFDQLSRMHQAHVAQVAPQNLSLTYIANLGVVRQLADLGVRLDI